MLFLRGRKNPAVQILSLHGLLTGPRIDALFIAALLPPLALEFLEQGVKLLTVFALSLAVAAAWQAVFSFIRKQPIGISSIIPAMAFALMVPAGAPLWQTALGLSFGVVVGVHLFGGYGWNFLNPVIVALVFLIFSFPESGYGNAPGVVWVACLPGAALLVVTGIISWRILLAAIVTLSAAVFLLAETSINPVMAVAGFVFMLVFLASDPVATPATDSARWIYAALIGFLSALGLASGKPQTQAFASAVLLGGIFAPLIEYGMIRAVAWRRRRRRAGHNG